MIQTGVQLGLESLYAGHVPHEVQSPTSTGAAESLMAQRRIALIALVLEAICNAGERGLTDDELQIVLNLRSQTQSPRRRELELTGLVNDSGKTRITRNKRPAVVWIATNQGLAMWREATAGGFLRQTDTVLPRLAEAIAQVRKHHGAKPPHCHQWRYVTAPNLYTPAACQRCAWVWLKGAVERNEPDERTLGAS